MFPISISLLKLHHSDSHTMITIYIHVIGLVALFPQTSHANSIRLVAIACTLPTGTAAAAAAAAILEERLGLLGFEIPDKQHDNYCDLV